MLPTSFKGWGGFSSSLCNTDSCRYGLQLFFSEVIFSGALRLLLCFSPPFIPFYTVLANSRTTWWALVFRQETANGEAHVLSVPEWHCSHGRSEGVLQGCWASGLLRSQERKISRDFLRTRLHSLNKWSNRQGGKWLINHFILLQIIFQKY